MRQRLFFRSAVYALISLFFLLSAAHVSAASGERITSFDSWISVEQSGLVTVIETISVVANGTQIKRGIYRDFPTEYTTPSGVRHKVGFTVLDVQRDGRSEPYHLKQMSNGIRVYIGDKNVFLKPGSYRYTLTYQTDRQVGFFADYDELYWNVTGNGWDFPIEYASATLNLPSGGIIQQSSMYTGRQGSTASDAESSVISGSEMVFRTTRPLGPREGLTFAAAWQKGVVKEPELKDKVGYFLRGNQFLLLGTGGLVVLLMYYGAIWLRVGKDPEPEAIIPRFEPPRGFTPAAARFVMRMGFDNKSFAAALVNMAVKKNITIANDEGTFTLSRSDANYDKSLSRGEKKIAKELFASSSTIQLKNTNHAKISASIKALKKSLQTDFEEMHFMRNSKYMLPGALISLAVIALIILSSREKPVALFMSVWLSGWSLGCYALFVKVFNAWKVARSEASSLGDKGAALFITIFSLPFLGGWIAGFSIFVSHTSVPAIITLFLVLTLNIVFYHLLKAPTVSGRRVMDKLEGLKMYLSVAEKDRLNLLNPPEKTPELFERLLPWALALDVEQEWSEQFSEILARAAAAGEYRPTWYSGYHSFSPASMASSLGSSLTGSISSSSTAPGSSSGSGGGGFSGGGGGGGGGGGW